MFGTRAVCGIVADSLLPYWASQSVDWADCCLLWATSPVEQEGEWALALLVGLLELEGALPQEGVGLDGCNDNGCNDKGFPSSF